MANIKSQIKRVLITKEENARNASKKSALKTLIKKYEATVAGGDVEAATAMLRDVFTAVDAAKSDHILTTNTAARRKARFSKMLDSMKASKAE